MLGNALVFGKIKAKLGGRFIAGVSGGGALPGAVDTFFGAAAAFSCSKATGSPRPRPVLAVRHQAGIRSPAPSGSILEGTECRIVAEDGSALPPGRWGSFTCAARR